VTIVLVFGKMTSLGISNESRADQYQLFSHGKIIRYQDIK
jgi:hypothetical protein